MERAGSQRILSVSYDSTLLKTRQLLLEARGYKVTSVNGFTRAIAECRNTGYDLLILGHSVPLADKLALIKESQQHSWAPILALLRPSESDVEGASRSLEASYAPDALVLVVQELLRAN